MSNFDYDTDHELISRFAAKAKRRDAINHLQAIAYAICFDGHVSDSELHMLGSFLSNHADLINDWPISSVWELLNRIMADGMVTLEERRILLKTLREYALHDLNEPASPLAEAASEPSRVTQTIFDDDVEVLFPGRAFVVTGVLELGKRGPFQARIAALGGIIHDKVKRDTDFVVVGVKGSQAWTTDKYGTKIEEAMQAKARGAAVRIVRELFAVEALLAAEAQRLRG